MKAILVLFFLVTVSSADEKKEEKALSSNLEDLLRKFLEYVKFILKKHEPYSLPGITNLHLEDSNIELVFSTSNVMVTKFEDFKIEYVKVDATPMKIDFGTRFPLVHQEGSCVLNGTFMNMTVEDSGNYTLEYTDSVQNITAELANVEDSIQVKNLTINYSIGDFMIKVDGVNIEGFNEYEINELLIRLFKKVIKEKKDLAVGRMMTNMKTVANQLLKGHNMVDVITWLQNLVELKPDPPPFTISELLV